MNGRDFVATVDEWKQLPELFGPTISGPSKSGSKYHVYKVGLVLSDLDQCRKAEVKPLGGIVGKSVLPTAVVDFGEERLLCRLPLELTDWTTKVIGMAQMGQLKFPCEVEFGTLEGRIYAEFL